MTTSRASTSTTATVAAIEDVVPDIVTDNPMDMEFGPDGALYVLEYGDGYFAENPDAQLSRIDYIGEGGNRSPVPAIEAEPTAGKAPLTVAFSSDGTTDPDGDTKLKYAWDFDGDGKVDSRKADGSYTYTEDGSYRATLTVTDKGGRRASADVDIVVGNEAPVVEFVTPVAGQAFSFGDTVTYEVRVTDDEPVDCSRVTVTYVLGHDTHGHPQSTASGCTGSLTTTVPEGHDPATDDLAAVFVAEYTDAGSEPASHRLRRGRPRAGRLIRGEAGPGRPGSASASPRPSRPPQTSREPPEKTRKKAAHVFRI